MNAKNTKIALLIAGIIIGIVFSYIMKNKDPEVASESTVSTESGDELTETAESDVVSYRFRNEKLLSEHYEKHGIEMGFDSKESYEAAASDVINNPDALSKHEMEDDDMVFYIEETNEFVVLSTDGYIRTYFLPNGGKSYFDRQ